MKQFLILSVMAVVPAIASAGGQAGSLGVGAELQLNGNVGGVSLDYDTGKFHLGGLIGLRDDAGPDNTVVAAGARFYYHMHSTANSDFGIGGQIGLLSFPQTADERGLGFYIEPGFQIRAFLTANVAINATAGLVIGAADADGLAVLGQPVAGAGIHYYFF